MSGNVLSNEGETEMEKDSPVIPAPEDIASEALPAQEPLLDPETISWATMESLLDKLAPGWSRVVRNVTVGGFVVVTASIDANGGTYRAVAVGLASEDAGIRAAEDAALIKAAVKVPVLTGRFHLGPEYFPDGSYLPSDPYPKTVGEMVLIRQLRMIRVLAAAAGVDPTAECLRKLQCEPGELSRRAGQAFIAHLESLTCESDDEGSDESGDKI
jgi:hypothetical protein